MGKIYLIAVLVYEIHLIEMYEKLSQTDSFMTVSLNELIAFWNQITCNVNLLRLLNNLHASGDWCPLT